MIKRRGRLAVIGPAVALVAVLFVPGAASAEGWSAPISVAPDASPALDPPALATNSRGELALAWVGPQASVRVAVLRPGGRVPRLIPGSSRFFGGSPQVAIDARGDIALAWRGLGGLLATLAPRGRHFGRPQRIPIPGDGVWNFELAFGPRGTAGVVFVGGGFVQAAFAPTDGRFGPPENASGYGPASEASLVFDGSDRATVLWTTVYGSAQQVRAARRGRRGFALPETLARPPADFAGTPFLSFRAKADVTGRETVVWVRDPDGVGESLEAATRSGVGPFGAEQTVLFSGSPIAYPNLSVAQDGWALLALVNADDRRGAAASLRPPGGSFGPVQPIAGEPAGSGLAGAIDKGGLAAVAWDAADGIQVSVHAAGGDFAPPQTVGLPGARFPVLAFGGGHGFLAWYLAGTGLDLSAYGG